VLLQRNVPVSVPRVALARRWADRTRTVAFPLFPGYVFARFGLAQPHTVISVPGLATVVRFGRRPVPVRAKRSRTSAKQLWLKVSQIRTLATERIGRRLARASEEDLARVIEGLNEIVGG
jgi:mRNA-degrading endonuclease toxin of MazEF toxin-antitoxin module